MKRLIKGYILERNEKVTKRLALLTFLLYKTIHYNVQVFF